MSYSLVRFPLESDAKVRTFCFPASMLQNIFSEILKLIPKQLILKHVFQHPFLCPETDLFRDTHNIYARTRELHSQALFITLQSLILFFHKRICYSLIPTSPRITKVSYSTSMSLVRRSFTSTLSIRAPSISTTSNEKPFHSSVSPD